MVTLAGPCGHFLKKFFLRIFSQGQQIMTKSRIARAKIICHFLPRLVLSRALLLLLASQES